MHDAAAGSVGFAGDRRLAIAGALGGVDDEHGDVRPRHRALGQDDAHRLDLPADRHAAGPPHARRVDDPKRALVPLQHHVDRVARRARHLAHHHALFAQQAVDERRLPDVRPADDGDRRLVLRGLGGRAVGGQPRDDLVEQLGHAVAVLGRDLDDGVESQPEELDRAAARLLVVRLVDGEDDRFAHRAQHARAISSSPGTSPSFASTTKTTRSALCSALRPCSTTSSCSGSVVAPNSPPVSTSVNDRSAPVGRGRQRIARRAGHGRDDRPPLAGDAVEEGGLADVRPADEHDRWPRAGAWSPHECTIAAPVCSIT